MFLSKKILVTGAAGFIGFHVCKRLIESGKKVIGIDNLNDYYDVDLKLSRLENLKNFENDFTFKRIDLVEENSLKNIFESYTPSIVIHLAAQAGVRYSLENPSSYINANIVGFLNLLECCRTHKIKHLIYASSSSVYGGNKKLPFSEKDSVDNPVSLYAATKKSNELMAYTYSHLFKIPSTGLRFFTVYGPWGRPDMSPMIFTKKILSNHPIEIFNHGNMARDFTYIDDVVHVIISLLNKPPKKNKKEKEIFAVPYQIFNVGYGETINLLDFVNLIEKELKIKAKKIFKPFQKGDIKVTSANTELIEEYINFKPKTSLNLGIKKFLEWYRKYYLI